MICSDKKGVVNKCFGNTKIDSLLKSLSNYIDWRAGEVEEMPDPKQITLALKECHNIIYNFDIIVRHSKEHSATMQKLKDILT